MKAILIFPTVFEAQGVFRLAGASARLGASANLEANGSLFCGFVSGCGCAASVERLKNFCAGKDFDFAVLCGFCGSCRADIGEGGLLFSSKSPAIKKAFLSCGIMAAKIATTESVAGFAEKKRLAERGFDAVDMEAALFEPVFGAEKFASFRAVSDAFDSKIPAEFFDQAIDRSTGGSSIKPFKILKALARDPALIARLIKFSAAASKIKKSYEESLCGLVLPALGSIR